MNHTSAEALRHEVVLHTRSGGCVRGHMINMKSCVTIRTRHRNNAAKTRINPVLEKPVLSRSFCSRLVTAAKAWNLPLVLAAVLLFSGFLSPAGRTTAVPLFLSVDSFRQGSRSSSTADRQPSGLSCISTTSLRSCAILTSGTRSRSTSVTNNVRLDCNSRETTTATILGVRRLQRALRLSVEIEPVTDDDCPTVNGGKLKKKKQNRFQGARARPHSTCRWPNTLLRYCACVWRVQTAGTRRIPVAAAAASTHYQFGGKISVANVVAEHDHYRDAVCTCDARLLCAYKCLIFALNSQYIN